MGEEATGNPWDKDIEAAFPDETARAAVSEFLAGKVQPYVTKLEQDSQQSRDANRLWNDFSERPTETFVSVAKELFDDEAAERALAAIEGRDVTPAVVPDATPDTGGDDDPPVSLDELPPEVQALLQEREDQKVEEQFKAEINRVKKEKFGEGDDTYDGPELKEELFYPFISATDGDFDLAAENYKAWANEAKGTFSPISDEILPGESTDPPPVVNNDSGGTAPPQVQEGQSLDEAIDDWLAEERGKADAPPTV